MSENPAIHQAKPPNLTPGNNGNIPPVHSRFGQPNGNPINSTYKAGACVAEWYNFMKEWNLEQLKAVTDDPKSPSAKCAAAAQWIQAREGKLPNLIEVCDRGNGGKLPQHNVNENHNTHYAKMIYRERSSDGAN